MTLDKFIKIGIIGFVINSEICSIKDKKYDNFVIT